MGLDDDIKCLEKRNKQLEKKIQELEEQSIAMILLKDSKMSNRKMAKEFALALIIVSIFWFATMIFLIYVLCNTNRIDETNSQNISGIDTINGNVVNEGDINGYDKTSIEKKN